MTTTTETEGFGAGVCLSGTWCDELRMTTWLRDADDGDEPDELVRFEIINGWDGPEASVFIDIPLDAVRSMVRALARSYERHSTGVRPKAKR